MYFVLGLLSAGLLALTVTPAIWRRAIRLTRARVEATTPMTLAEINAGRDQLRAEFAISTRRLEAKLETVERRAMDQNIAFDKARAEIAGLTVDVAEKVATIAGLEGRIRAMGDEQAAAAARIGALLSEVASRDEKLGERAARIAELERSLASALDTIDEQKVELVARSTEIGNLRDQLSASRAGEAAVSKVRDELAASLARETADLAAERRKTESLEARIGVLEVERTDRMAAIERHAGEIKAFEAEIAAEAMRRDALTAEIDRFKADRADSAAAIAARMTEIEALKVDLAAAASERRVLEERLSATSAGLAEALARSVPEATAAGAAAADSDDLGRMVAVLESEKAAFAARLVALESDHAAARREIDRLRAAAEAAGKADAAALRTKLDEVAASILRMAEPAKPAEAGGAPEPAVQPDRPVEVAAPRAADNGTQRNGGEEKPHLAEVTPLQPAPSPAPAAPPVETGRSLAQRIRALQHAGARH